MKKNTLFFGLMLILFFACKKDDEVTCVTCSSEITLSFTLCKEANGNASVNGEDTGTNYNLYYQGLMEEGVQCQ